MVGSAIVRELERQGYTNIVTCTHKELDLTPAGCCGSIFCRGEAGICISWQLRRWAALWPTRNALADFMYDNMILEMNVIHSAWKNGCKKLEFLGSFLYLSDAWHRSP